MVKGERMIFKDHCWQFICEDCGYEIYSFGSQPPQEVCATCQFLRENPDISASIRAILREEEE
jgi:hypothetical protein